MSPPLSSLLKTLIKLSSVVILLVVTIVATSWWWQTRPLEKVTLEPNELKEVVEQINPVIESIKKGVAPPTTSIELTSRQLNGYINHVSDYGSKVHFEFKDGFIQTEVIDKLPKTAPAFAEKKVRLTFELHAKVIGGRLELSADKVCCFGVGLPEKWVKEYTKKDLLPMIQKRLNLNESTNMMGGVTINEEKIRLDFGSPKQLLTERSTNR